MALDLPRQTGSQLQRTLLYKSLSEGILNARELEGRNVLEGGDLKEWEIVRALGHFIPANRANEANELALSFYAILFRQE